MMWLPQQSLSDWLTSVDALIEAGPEHASLYLLESSQRPASRRHGLGWSLAPDEDAADMHVEALARLEERAEQYEISNVARLGRSARHNVKHWQDGEWLGFACGAHSTRAGVRWRNVPATMDYIQRIAAGAPVIAERRVLDTEERVEEALFTDFA